MSETTAMGTTLWIAATIAGFLALVYFFQDRMLYFPSRASVEQMVSRDLRPWPSAADFRGLVAEPRGTARGTVIVFHGNAGHAGHRDFYAQAWTPMGWRVILAEYPGYGPRDGNPSEHSLIADATQTIAVAHERLGGPIVLAGESLGAAVAAGAGSLQRDRIQGLLLITPWDHLANVASHHYPWLPVRWLLRDGYDTARRLVGFNRKVVVVVAEQDSIVPARFGMALHESLGSVSALIAIPGAGHNDWPGRVAIEWWRDALNAASGPAE